MATYANITAPTSPEQFQGGYKDVFYLAPLADFTILQPPLATTDLGDKYTIESAHTFGVGLGFYNWVCKTDSVRLTAESVGEKGARLIRYRVEFQIVTDSAATQEQMTMILNQKNIYLIKDANCLTADSYIQLGDDCKQASFTVAFDGGQEENLKTWTVTGEIIQKRFFYNAAIVEAA
jgi:hypothetical protein